MGKLKVRYAIIGCGEHGFQSHAVPCRDSDVLELVGVFDPSAEAMDVFVHGYLAYLEEPVSLTKFASEEELRNCKDVDAVVITSPDQFHITSALKCLQAGKHVFCEKPLAVDVDQLKLLKQSIDLASEKGLVFTSCHPRRYDPPFVWMKNNLPRLVSQHGKVKQFTFSFEYHRPTKTKHASLMFDHVNHELDMLHFLFGYSPFNIQKHHDSQLEYEVSGLREDGLEFRFDGKRLLAEKKYHESIDLTFEDGTVLLLQADIGHVFIDLYLLVNSDLEGTNYDVRNLLTTENFANAILGIDENYLIPRDLWLNNVVAVDLSEHDKAGYTPGVDC